MRLLFLCPHFEPDLHAATGEVMTKLVHALTDRGHTVDVVTSLPWYRLHDVEPDWRGRPWRKEQTAHGTIIRVWPFPTDKSNVPARAAAFAGFTSIATAAALSLPKPDAVLAMSPPIFLGNAAAAVARRWKVPFVFNVQDIFPDVAVEVGALTRPKVIEGARKLERSLYRQAAAVTVLSEDQAANVRAKVHPDEVDKVRIIANFVDLDRVHVTERENPWRVEKGLSGKTIVMYAGNVGMSQSFDLIEHAATAYTDRPEVHFVINGEGSGRSGVEAWADRHDNVSVFDFVGREGVSDLLGAADLHLILLKAGLARSSTPSKLYGIMAAGRPILASIDVGSEVDQIVEAASSGQTVAPDQPEAFLAVLNAMLEEPMELRAMGERARNYVEQLLTPETQAVAYEQLFTEMIDISGEGRAYRPNRRRDSSRRAPSRAFEQQSDRRQ